MAEMVRRPSFAPLKSSAPPVDSDTMHKQAVAVLAAVVTLMVAGFGVLLVRSDGDGGSSYEAPQADAREVACIQAGGDWTYIGIGATNGPSPRAGSCKSRVALESELAEQARTDFCRGLPERMRSAKIPEKCLDFYGPDITTTTPRATRP